MIFFYGIGRKAIDIGFLMLLSVGALYAGARTGLMPKEPSQGVAVIFAPWTSATEAISQTAAAGGRFVRFGGLPFIAVVVPDDASYADRMFSNGAWLVLDPQALAACSSALSFGGKS